MAFQLDRVAAENEHFRTVLFTTPRSQLAVMSVGPGGVIPGEVHETSDQFFRVESGSGVFTVKSGGGFIEYDLGPGGALVVPAGAWHEVRNAGRAPLKLSTIYSPPHA